jgi:S-adenosylmethionine:tRNA ribosyltransferase-isomerase
MKFPQKNSTDVKKLINFSYILCRMNLNNFTYLLPKELIAQEPAKPRTHSRLMILKDNKIIHDKFYNIVNYLNKGDVLVLNETKVMKIRLKGKKQTSGKIELMLEDNTGHAVIKGKVKLGDKLFFPKKIEGIIIEKNENKLKINFNKKIDEIIKQIGELPTPPYIKKPLDKDSQYQTVYAKKQGSLAAPTAGLHFDKNLLNKLKKKGIKLAKVCLHVSWDTFLPVREQDISKHKMHGEYCEIDEKNADIINNAKRLFVVGTTTLKTLETFANSGKIVPGEKISNIFIYPGYKFKLKYSGLITNFHLPRSTLILLVSAFYGRENILSAYNLAVKEKYRFYSLGDAMFLLKENSHPQ